MAISLPFSKRGERQMFYVRVQHFWRKKPKLVAHNLNARWVVIYFLYLILSIVKKDLSQLRKRNIFNFKKRGSSST